MNRMPANPACFGHCASCGTTHSLPIGNSRKYAYELMARLDTFKRVDDGTNPELSTEFLWSDMRGKMFGVLECEHAEGHIVILKAFSCQYNGEWLIEGWVPPVLNADKFHHLSDPIDKEIKQLDQLIKKENGPELIRKRRDLSRKLMKDIHALYHLTNFCGETRPLTNVFPTSGIPTGVGDCCAPKLLNHAALHGLNPVGLSEFYWGKESKSGTRQHGEFYPVCAEKCQPILGFMLCGLNPQLEIVHEDSEFIVVNKPSGLLSVPGKGPENQDCVVARVKKMFPNCPDHPEVHRLDMDTSGLMVLALTKEVHRELSRQFHDRETGKRYIALLDGELTGNSGTIELPFRLDVDNRPVQIYDPVHGKTGITHWKKLSIDTGQTRVEFQPVTGRTHQLRVHAASKHGLGTPIAGDRLYGTGTAPGQLKLHAVFLSFTHPSTGEKIALNSDPLF